MTGRSKWEWSLDDEGGSRSAEATSNGSIWVKKREEPERPNKPKKDEPRPK
jgi:hypothetical protein